MVVREGTNVTLTCKAKGFPEPYVMWRREDGDEMAISGENGEISFMIKMNLFCLTSIIVCFFSPIFKCLVNVVDGEILSITKVSRLHMAAYLCVASNGVPPSISKRVQLRVQCRWNKIVGLFIWNLIFEYYYSSSNALNSKSTWRCLFGSRSYSWVSYWSISGINKLLDNWERRYDNIW